jgi:uncharacterized protein YjgD (DUF1641 family)
MTMKRRRFIPFLFALAVLLLMAGCGGKYADAKKVNKEYMALVQGYIDDLDKTESAQDAAKAIDRFADGMQALLPKMKALAEKYPELKDRDNIPEELKEMQAEAAEVGKKMGSAMMKLMPYMQDPEVQKAQKRLQETMKKQ